MVSTTSVAEPSLLVCWGKTAQEGDAYHPALFHLLDVGHVARCLLTDPASRRWRNVLGRALVTDPDQLVEWFPWFIAMHDIGKFSIPFQGQSAEQMARLRTIGIDFGNWTPNIRIHHTHYGQEVLRREFQELELPPILQTAWAEMVGGHHGIYATSQSARDTRRSLRAFREPDVWATWRRQAADILRSVLFTTAFPPLAEPSNVSAAIAVMNGFAILCDWLGSDHHRFDLHPTTPLEDYIDVSRRKAWESVEAVGFTAATASRAPVTFVGLFADRAPGRPLQQAIDDIPDEVLSRPCLAIVEAPTGEGKTEAALTLAHRIGRLRGTDEFYCALPTTATSNQMYGRVLSYLRDQLDLEIGAKLIHGQAFLIEDDLRMSPLVNGETDKPHPTLEWFSPRKRALLAPFGVGTIDQAELSALNVRHQALRQIGLAGKVVILDEVHAYDTYMTTVIERMLNWLSAIGSSVILLSATLPLSRRAALARAYGAIDTGPVSGSYPSIWVGDTAGSYEASPQAYREQQSLALNIIHWEHEDSVSKARWLLGLVADGGSVCWICNTVARSQALFAAVRLLDSSVSCDLLHAQFPLEERQTRERRISEIYGPTGTRPARGIVIGTQVLEQSLDLDFDVMVSDLAPVDLLLQRAGRLHRHSRPRPAAHAVPRLWLQAEVDSANELILGADRFYTEYILRQTWSLLRDRKQIHLPEEYRPLIEAVYGDSPPRNGPLAAAWQKLEQEQARQRDEATLRLVPEPNPDEPFTIAPRDTFVEDEDGTAWIVAQTRLGAETLTVIPLTRVGDRAEIVPGEWVDLSRPASREMQLRLLRRSVRLSQATAVRALNEDVGPVAPLFAESPLLRNVQPLWLQPEGVRLAAAGRAVVLRLDDELGVVVDRVRRDPDEKESMNESES